MSGFVHLHLHTTYSLLDDQCSILGLVARAKQLGMSAVAVTDHGNLYALKAFYDEARKAGIKPILGVDVWEHSYYIDYRNRRAAHLQSLWQIINWDEINRRYLAE